MKKMKLNLTTDNMLKIFGKKLVIPSNQRPYSWKIDQWDTFFDDLDKASLNNEEHYFGTIYTSVIDRQDGRMSVIDGQQRITTTFLFIATMFLEGSKKLQNDIRNLILPNKSKMLVSDTADRFGLETVWKMIEEEIFYTEEDFLKTVKKLTYSETKYRTVQESSKRMYSAMKHFSEKIKHEADDKKHIVILEELELLFETISKSFFLTDIRVDVQKPNGSEVAYHLFEDINAKGVGLSDFDKFKNKIFLTAREYDIIYESSQYKDISEKWGRIQSYFDSNILDAFIIAMSTIDSEVKILDDLIYKSILKKFSKTASIEGKMIFISKMMNELDENKELIKMLFEYDKSDIISSKQKSSIYIMSEYKKIALPLIYIMMKSYIRVIDDEADFIDVEMKNMFDHDIKKMTKAIVLRMGVLDGTKQVQDILMEIRRVTIRKGYDIKSIIKIINSTNCGEEVYDNLANVSERVAFFFNCLLSDEMETNPDLHIMNDLYKRKNNVSGDDKKMEKQLEHIFPQTYKNIPEWVTVRDTFIARHNDNNLDNPLTIKAFAKEIISSIGNIVPLPAKANIIAGNSFTKIKDTYMSDKTTKTTMINNVIGLSNNGAWTPIMIKSRTAEIIKKAKHLNILEVKYEVTTSE